MPLGISHFSLDNDHLNQLSGVLREDPSITRELETVLGQSGFQLWVGIFNARPVSLLLLEEHQDDWHARQLVVHPATRGRGVAAETLRLCALQQRFHYPPALHSLAVKAGLV